MVSLLGLNAPDKLDGDADKLGGILQGVEGKMQE
jgi:hypothetical protein